MPSDIITITVPANPIEVMEVQVPGQQGPAGPPNTLTIGTINTLAEGQAATGTITGISPNQTLNLSIPRGYGVRGAGLTGQVLVKRTDADYDTEWAPVGTGTSANEIAKRDNAGWLAAMGVYIENQPTDAYAATRKDYVDALGTPSDVPNTVVRRSENGAVSLAGIDLGRAPDQPYHATRKDYVDALGTNAPEPNTIVRRGANGSTLFTRVYSSDGPPIDPDELARKDYVDNGLAGKVANGAGITTMTKITQTAYDALGTKDANTLYVIVG